MRGQMEEWESDGYAIGMECEGSARMEEGKRNQGWLHTWILTSYTKMAVKKQQTTAPASSAKQIGVHNYWYDTT